MKEVKNIKKIETKKLLTKLLYFPINLDIIPIESIQDGIQILKPFEAMNISIEITTLIREIMQKWTKEISTHKSMENYSIEDSDDMLNNVMTLEQAHFHIALKTIMQIESSVRSNFVLPLCGRSYFLLRLFFQIIF